MSRAFDTALVYRPMSVEDYKAKRLAELNEFIGPIIAAIYQSIRDGALDNASDYEAAAGRPHQRWDAYFNALRDA